MTHRRSLAVAGLACFLASGCSFTVGHLRGTVMRNLTVSSDHTFYVLFGQHCYTVRGEVFG